MWKTHSAIHTSVDCDGWVRHSRGSSSARAILKLWTTAVDSPVDREGLARRLDLDLHGRDNVGMEPDLHLNRPELLERLVEHDLAPVDLCAGLLVHGVRDVDGRDRAEQLAFAACARLDRDGATFELRRERLRRFAVSLVARITV